MYSLLASLSPVYDGSKNRHPISIKVKVFRMVHGYGKYFMPTVDFILVDENVRSLAIMFTLPSGDVCT